MTGRGGYDRAGKAPAAPQEEILTELRLRPELVSKWKYPRRTAVKKTAAADAHPPPLEGGLKVVRHGGVEFLNNFDSANGEVFPHDGPPDVVKRFHILLKADPSDGTESTGRRRWFHFGVRCVGKEPVRARFVVNNLSNMLDLYNLDGHRPFFLQVPSAAGWRRLTEANFACHEEVLEDKQDEVKKASRVKDEILLPRVRQLLEGEKKRKSCYIAWDFQLDHGVTTYFAFSPPFNYCSMQSYLRRLEDFFRGSPRGQPLPAYMAAIEAHGGGSGTRHGSRGGKPQAPFVKVTVEHGGEAKKMYVWVRKDATMLQVRQAVAEALKVKRTSQVKLVKRLGSDRLMTSVPDSERLSQKCHVLMVGTDFPDGLTAKRPEEPKELPEPLEPLPEPPELTSEPWEPLCGEDVYFHRERLCLTKEGRRVELLTVSAGGSPPGSLETPPAAFLTASVAVDGDSPAAVFADRPVAFISARVHPGETPGQFAFLGMLRFLLSDDARAALLRQQFVFKLVPMLNPDGVARGHTRANVCGLDLNRCYSDANPTEHEGVFWALEWLKHWAEQGRLLVYLDMHAHAHTRGCVLYGNRLQGMSQVWNVAFARLCAVNGPHFDFEGCEFPPTSDKEHGNEESCGRASVAALCGLSHAYTLECHYSVGRQARPVEEVPLQRPHPGMLVPFLCQVPYGVYEWESIGEVLAVSILDLHGSNPFSRPSAQLAPVLGEVLNRLSPGKKQEEMMAANPRQALKPANWDEEYQDVQLWRVLHCVVVARERPDLEGQVLEVFCRGQLLAAEEVPGSLWVRLCTPGGLLGGKLNTDLSLVNKPAAYMLTDGTAKGLGQLLQKTDLWIRLKQKADAGLIRPGSLAFGHGLKAGGIQEITLHVQDCPKKAKVPAEKQTQDWSLILEIDTSEHHSRTMRSLAWNVDGTKLAVASFDATISVWKVVPGSETPGCLSMECATVLSGHENEVKSVAYSPSGQLFASCSRDRSVWVYDAQETDEYECVALLQSHTQDVKAVRWHPQQDVLFSCSYDDTIKVWGPDGDDWCCKETLEGHGSTVWALCFDEKGSHFVSCSDDRNLRLWAPTAALPKDFRPVENEGSPKLQAKGDAKASAATLFSAAMTLPLFRGTLVPTARPVPNGKDVEA
ncbi:unnamed protein product [Effrenium voratum]|uniref:Peptidase M14 domain-containing protein n=1 Tax=Effrenium voratum TaxID=2562239 RepID=A0AA36ISW3_9DINO|nr:unnamed protein product [Effrenium voratum]